MVFSSVPAYLDPSNWQPQHINHQIIGNSATNPLLPPAAGAPPPPPHGGPGSGSGSGSIRPGSMSERARLANIPMPEAALKCPRCESTNTKFCYFNNYSLSQPRHFCKTCRRYWTRGGALRSVPVGGGCRRNKRSKSAAASKSSPASSDGNNRNSGSTSGANNTVSNNNNNNNNNNNSNLLNLTPPPQFQPLRFMSPLGQLSDGFAGDLGLSSYASGANDQMGFHGGSSFLGMEPWKLQQFPFLGGLDPAAATGGVYQFHGGELGFLGGGGSGGETRPKISSSLLSQMASVKMEDSQNPNLRQLLGGMQGNGNDEHWNNSNVTGNGAVNWTELSNFSSSSTSNPLQ